MIVWLYHSSKTVGSRSFKKSQLFQKKRLYFCLEFIAPFSGSLWSVIIMDCLHLPIVDILYLLSACSLLKAACKDEHHNTVRGCQLTKHDSSIRLLSSRRKLLVVAIPNSFQKCFQPRKICHLQTVCSNNGCQINGAFLQNFFSVSSTWTCLIHHHTLLYSVLHFSPNDIKAFLFRCT